MTKDKDYFDELISSSSYREALAAMEKDRNKFSELLERLAKLEQENAELKKEVEIGKQICGNAMGVIAELQNKLHRFGDNKKLFWRGHSISLGCKRSVIDLFVSNAINAEKEKDK